MQGCPRMLTIKQTAAETNLPYELIRKLCLQNKIVFIRTGNKYLINYEKFIDYLNGENPIEHVDK